MRKKDHSQQKKLSTPPSTQLFGLRVGILGGGQLARMLILEGHRLGLEMHVLCPKANEPAALVTPNWHQGNPHHKSDIVQFCHKIDVLTFESEFFHGQLLEEIHHKGQVQIHPAPNVMRQLQDRLFQKELLIQHKVPTADFLAIHNADDVKMAASHFKNKFVLKKRFGGYDGNGTFIIRSRQDLEKTLEKLPLVENEFIAEAFVPFQKELAMIFVRNQSGQIIHLPLVQTQQTHHRLDWLMGPIHHPQQTMIVGKIKRFLNEIQYVGAIGFEFFAHNKNILVNEIAPRVHNSGHYSQDALSSSQFTLHLQAILNCPLSPVQMLADAFASVNLIGQSAEPARFPTQLTGTLHWYGKADNRQGRKMGHVNYLGKNCTQVLKLALKERGKFHL